MLQSTGCISSRGERDCRVPHRLGRIVRGFLRREASSLSCEISRSGRAWPQAHRGCAPTSTGNRGTGCSDGPGRGCGGRGRGSTQRVWICACSQSAWGPHSRSCVGHEKGPWRRINKRRRKSTLCGEAPSPRTYARDAPSSRTAYVSKRASASHRRVLLLTGAPSLSHLFLAHGLGGHRSTNHSNATDSIISFDTANHHWGTIELL